MEDSQIYNRRQYTRMLEAISEYEKGRLNLKSLIADLEGLVGALRDVPDEWTNRFRQTWGILDDVYADLVYRELKYPDDLSAELIADALHDLKKQIEQQ